MDTSCKVSLKKSKVESSDGLLGPFVSHFPPGYRNIEIACSLGIVSQLCFVRAGILSVPVSTAGKSQLRLGLCLCDLHGWRC